MKTKVSIIVPIHNNERTLKRCVDSLLEQTLKEIEIILLDDSSTDGSSTMVDNYTQLDMRVTAIHQSCGGFGEAVNVGLDNSIGEYISIVSPNDWLEKEACEVLYEQGHKYRVDIQKCHCRLVENDTKGTVISPFHKFHIDRLIEKVEIILPYHSSFSEWRGTLYSASFLRKNQLRFTELLKYEHENDAGFAWRLMSKVRRCYISCKCYYNITPISEKRSTASLISGFIAMQSQLWSWCSQQDRVFYDKHCLKPLYDGILYCVHRNCWGLQKLTFIKKMAPLLHMCVKDADFSSFSRHERREFKFMAHHPVSWALRCMLYSKYAFEGYKSTKVLGVRITSSRRTGDKLTRSLLGLPYMKEREKNGCKKRYLLGFCYRSESILAKNPKRMLQQRKREETAALGIGLYAQDVYNQHQKTFLKYQCCHHGQDIVLLATGPSLHDAPQLGNVICCGVNRIITMKQYKLHYCFMQDYAAVKDYIEETFEADCVNFFGYEIHRSHDNFCAIPKYIEEKAKAVRYYTHWLSSNVYGDISSFPLFNYDTVAHPALNFLLYTHPRRIYLIGCDCANTGYFDANVASAGLNPSNIRTGYEMLKSLRDTYYPDVEIVSVNPVGLRGLFRDTYTKKYLAKHPEIKVDEESILDYIG